MKRLIAVMAVLAFFFSVGISSAEEKSKVSWRVIGDASVSIHNKYADEITGEMYYDNPISTQSATVGVEKENTGLYIKAENYAPLRHEPKETDVYFGFYTEACGMEFDVGFAHYWMREKGEIDYNAIYGEVNFPEVIWGIVPFLKAEYRFATQKEWVEDEEGNEYSNSLDGFAYYGGFKREFKVTEKVSLNVEVGAGGNTGIYGGQAENLAYAREKVEVSVELIENLNLKIAGMTQQNLGRKDGISSRTDKPFVGASIVWNF
ncbi:MAG: hypothetical protein WC906_04730 [Parcubacteria group bacterium]|jgi:hypothetical protein